MIKHIKYATGPKPWKTTQMRYAVRKRRNLTKAEQLRIFKRWINNEKLSVRRLAGQYGIHRSTVYRVLLRMMERMGA